MQKNLFSAGYHSRTSSKAASWHEDADFGGMKISSGSPGHAGLLHFCQQEQCRWSRRGDGVEVSLLFPPFVTPYSNPKSTGCESVRSITQCIPASFGEGLQLFLPHRRWGECGIMWLFLSHKLCEQSMEKDFWKTHRSRVLSLLGKWTATRRQGNWDQSFI